MIKMPAACGIACEICGFADRGMCLVGDRCTAGNDPKAPEKLERFKAATGSTCLILDCAIKNNVDYCFRCDKFPCEIHYQQEIYSHKLLDLIKGMQGKK
jgi:hypothetical protein